MLLLIVQKLFQKEAQKSEEIVSIPNAQELQLTWKFSKCKKTMLLSGPISGLRAHIVPV